MKSFLRCAVLLVAACVPTLCQETGPDPADAGRAQPAPAGAGARRDDVSRLLKSGVNAERAWGAYLVGAHELEGETATLVGLLTDPALGTGPEENLVRQAALDSLIRLGAKAPADSLRPLYRTFPNEVVILMSRAPGEGGPALLEFFGESMPAARWLAVGNLLSEVKTRGFAAALLRELKVEADVFVLDAAEQDTYYGGGGGSGGCGNGDARAPEGFPPVGFYALTDDPVRGATSFAPGSHPVYYVRTPYAGSCVGNIFFGSDERDARRLEYLAELLGTTTDELNFRVRPFRSIVYGDARQFRRALAALRGEIERGHAALLARLVAENHLGGTEASELRPDITFHLSDGRADKSPPLPETLKGVKLSVE